jgi:hypothetical protein
MQPYKAHAFKLAYAKWFIVQDTLRDPNTRSYLVSFLCPAHAPILQCKALVMQAT